MLQFFRTLSQCVTPVDQGAEVGNVEKDVHCLAWIVLQVLGLGGIDLELSNVKAGAHQAEVGFCDCVDFNPEEKDPRDCVHKKNTDCLKVQQTGDDDN